jgi:hypothetical protein
VATIATFEGPPKKSSGIADSKANQMPLVGLILKVVLAPVPIAGSGKITTVATIDGSDRIIGALNNYRSEFQLLANATIAASRVGS